MGNLAHIVAFWRQYRERSEPVVDEPDTRVPTEDEQVPQPVDDARQVEQDELLGLLVMR